MIPHENDNNPTSHYEITNLPFLIIVAVNHFSVFLVLFLIKGIRRIFIYIAYNHIIKM
ncbi:hypothetical protein Hanom_Chr15g01371101 [Helianthus anomalus]